MKIILFLFFLSLNFTFAQVGNTYDEGAELQTGAPDTPFIRASTNSIGEVEGSEYLNEEWGQATVIDLNINKKVKLLARFNAYTKEIELLKEKNILSLKPVKGVSVELNDKKFVPAKLENTSRSIFVERLVGDATGLFRYYDTKIIKAASDATLLNLDNKDKLTITEKIYYGQAESIQKLPSKKKAIEKIFDKDVLKYAKEEKLSLKKEADLIRVFEFQNKKK